MKNKKVVVFDLDDTLTLELDFLKSAFRQIAKKVDLDNANGLYEAMLKRYEIKEDVFGWLCSSYPQFEKNNLIEFYRNHYPQLKLSEDVKGVLDEIKGEGHVLGLISDGRSITQRNKLKALGIEKYFDKVVISEEIGTTKPEEQNYGAFEEFNSDECYYIADNVKKDFVTPNFLGWTTICLLDKGFNIHKQSFEYPKNFLPHYKIDSIKELLGIISL